MKSSNILCLKTLKTRFDVRPVRCLSVSPSINYQNVNIRANSQSYGERPKSRVSHPYDQLFPWKSLSEFSHHLLENKVYFDGHLLALEKPWGVGTYKSTINITDKNSHLSTALYSGSCNYCLNDSIEYLCQMLGTKSLKIIKTINRFMSGIVLMSTDDSTETKVLKAVRRAQAMEVPTMSFWCVTKGWPTIDGNELRERIGIKLLELDELGNHKQPIIVSAQQLTNTMRRRKNPQPDGMIVKPALIDLKTLDINKTLGVSLVQLSTNVLKWNLIECYLAFKTSFVLGINRLIVKFLICFKFVYFFRG